MAGKEPERQGTMIRLDELGGVVDKRRVRSRYIVLWGCPQILSFLRSSGFPFRRE